MDTEEIYYDHYDQKSEVDEYARMQTFFVPFLSGAHPCRGWGGGVSSEYLVGLFGSALQTLTLFQTNL